MKIPRIIIAGTHSGCGKTTIARGIMAELVKKGFIVQPFKVGPDFIDPSHHKKICGRASRNLDPFIMGVEGVRNTFFNSCVGADIAIIEGVMGLFDGIDGDNFGSTAHVATILKSPVILVIDTRGMSTSANATALGFFQFRKDINIRAAIFNRIGSDRHRTLIEKQLNVPVAGWVPRDNKRFSIESRHLGLLMADETSSDIPDIHEFCDIEKILSYALSAPDISWDIAQYPSTEDKVRIGIAYDNAFCFYYEDNLDLLQRTGAILEFFSPMENKVPDVDAIYLGGGYPELYSEPLESSHARQRIKTMAECGIPVYAECGGLLYLCSELSQEKTYKMAGILPASAYMTSSLQALGYTDGKFKTGPLKIGIEVKGHEFHYSKVVTDNDARFSLELTRGKGISDGKDGLYSHSSTGCYTHTYFSKEFVIDLLRIAKENKRR